MNSDYPGGLPNSFLTRNAATFLIFDSIMCDQDALESEELYAGSWLSSDIFSALKDEGLLIPIKMRDHLPEKVMEELHRSGEYETAIETMEIELSRIKTETRNPRSLRVAPNLAELNRRMFYQLEIPNAIHYDWKDGYFKPQRLEPDTSTNGAEQLQGAEAFALVIRRLLPEFTLVPQVLPNSRSSGALREVIAKEKIAALQEIYGDPEMPPGRFTDLRLGSDFRRLDLEIDEPRRAQAWQNFELLMKVRRETKDLRPGLRAIFTDIQASTPWLKNQGNVILGR